MRQFYISKRFLLKDKSNTANIRRNFEERLGKTFKILHLIENQSGKIDMRLLPRARSFFLLRGADIKAECEFILEGKELRILCFGTIRTPREKQFFNIAVFAALFMIFWSCRQFTQSIGHIDIGELLALLSIIFYFRWRADKRKAYAFALLKDFFDSYECEFKE